eukprot:526095_1
MRRRHTTPTASPQRASSATAHGMHDMFGSMMSMGGDGDAQRRTYARDGTGQRCTCTANESTRLDIAERVDTPEFVEKYFDGVVDYKKYMKLMRKQKREMMRIAKKNKLKELNRKLLKSDWKCLRLSKIYKGDYVLLKRTKSLSKRDASFDFGWFVLGVERNHDKEIYVIRNIFDNE